MKYYKWSSIVQFPSLSQLSNICTAMSAIHRPEAWRDISGVNYQTRQVTKELIRQIKPVTHTSILSLHIYRNRQQTKSSNVKILFIKGFFFNPHPSIFYTVSRSEAKKRLFQIKNFLIIQKKPRNNQKKRKCEI